MSDLFDNLSDKEVSNFEDNKISIRSSNQSHISNFDDYDNLEEFLKKEFEKSNTQLDIDYYIEYFNLNSLTFKRKIQELELKYIFFYFNRKLTQFDFLVEHKDEVIKDIQNPSVTRTEFLEKYNSSTRALSKFMKEFDVNWVRKPHNGKNQFTDNPIEKIVEQRLIVESGLETNNLVFKGNEKLLDKTGVYRIVSSTGGVYIGMASVNFKRRFYAHRSSLNKNEHHCKGLQRAFNNNPNMAFEIIEVIEDREAVALREREIWCEYKDKNTKLYNGEPDGRANVLHTEETKAKLSQIALDRSAFSEEEILEIKTRLQAGESKRSIKLDLNTSAKRITRLIEENNWDISDDFRINKHMDEIISMAREGVPYRDVARKFSINRDKIHSIYKDLDLFYETGELSEEQKTIALDMYSKEAKSMKEIGEAIKASYSRIQSYLSSVNAAKGLEDIWFIDRDSGEIVINEKLLRELKEVEKLSTKEISVRLNLDPRIVRQNISRINL